MANPPGQHINDRMYRSYDDRASGEDTLQVVSLAGDNVTTIIDLLSARADHSDGNSTTTPLGANESFVGEWEEVAEYVAVTILGRTDQVSATNGAMVQWSHDGVTAVRTVARTIGADALNVGLFFAFPVEGKFFRLIYTNGPTPQTVSIIHTVYRRDPASLNLQMLGAEINDLFIANVSRAVITAKNPLGGYVNVRATTDENIAVSIEEATAEVPIASLADFATNQADVGTSAVQIAGAVAVGARRSISLKARASNTQSIFIGASSSVSTGNGYELSPGDSVDLELDGAKVIWAVAGGGTQRICWLEVGNP